MTIGYIKVDKGESIQGSSNIPGEQSAFKRSPCPGYAIDDGPSGLALPIYKPLSTKLISLDCRTLNLSPQLLRLIRIQFLILHDLLKLLYPYKFTPDATFLKDGPVFYQNGSMDGDVRKKKIGEVKMIMDIPVNSRR